MPESSRKSFVISTAVSVLTIGFGLFLLRHDPQAKGFLVIFGLFCSIALRHALDAREIRKRESSKRPR